MSATSNIVVTVVPGYLPQDGEVVTNAVLRAIAQPSISVAAAISAASIADGSVTESKLAAGALGADAYGRSVMANLFLQYQHFSAGCFPASANGWAPFASGWLPLSLVGSGIFTATAAGRAPFASGFVSAALAQPDAYSYASAGGTGTAYTATFSPALTSYLNPSGGQLYTNYWDGLVVQFKAPAASVGSANPTVASSTLNVDGLGAKTIYRKDGTGVQAGDIAASSVVQVVYNSSLNSGGGGWQLLTPPAPPAAQAGVVTYPASTASLVVTLTYAMPNTSYLVLVAPAAALASANNWYAVVNSTTQFTIYTSAGSGFGSAVLLNWLAVQRTQ